MSINFESLVSHLFRDHVDSKYPLNYFKREFLKALKENYDSETFFNSCLDVINSMEGEMDFQFYHVHPGYITKYFDEPTKDFVEQLIKTPRNNFDFQLIRNIENQNIRIVVFCEDFLKIKDAINVTYKEAQKSEKINLPDLSLADFIDENQTKNTLTYFSSEKPLSQNENDSSFTQKFNQGDIQAKTKSEKLKVKLCTYGFFILPLVKSLTDEKKEKLIELVGSNKLPYCIAMFEYLEFIKYLMKNHFKSNKAMHIEMSKWLDSDIDGRSIRGNISTLLKSTNGNNHRYTAFNFNEKVKEDYRNLK